MSATLFDLAQRFRAATLGCPVARASYAPVLPPVEPVAVSLAGSRDRVLVRASDGIGLTTGSGPGALSALADLGVSTGGEVRTLVVADRDTLSALLDLARATDRDSASAGAAAVLGWWSQRADHPGAGAVLMVIPACSARWVLGVPPATERRLEVWRQWLGVADAGPSGLLQLASTVSAGRTLPGLEAFVEDDLRSWEAFTDRVNDSTTPWDWRARDSRREAALGLATRCDAAELYESLRLGDPLVALRESFSGTVVSGVLSAMHSRSVVELTLDHLACRLREGTAVEGYPGDPRDLPAGGAASPALRGTVTASCVTADERLVLTISEAILRPQQARIGQHITLRPRAIDPRQQRSGRQELHRRYAARRSWLSGGPPPAPRRRDVPLDVAIAAAE